MLNHGDVSLALDSSAGSFLWQPYKDSPKLYNEKDRWVWFNSDSHQYLESFARCLRNSELVGIDCVEMYLPHRVAMQFGLDQDIPEKVAHCKENNPKIAWRNYDTPMTDTMLCIAAVASSSTLEAGVTCKYLEWWEQSKLGLGKQPGMSRIPINVSQTSSEMGSPVHKDHTGNSDQDRGSTIKKMQKRPYCSETDVSLSDGVEKVVSDGNINVAGGIKRAKLYSKIENVIEKSETAKDGNSGDKGNEGECASDWTPDKYFSDFESRIEYLERVVAQLKAEEFGHKHGD